MEMCNYMQHVVEAYFVMSAGLESEDCRLVSRIFKENAAYKPTSFPFYLSLIITSLADAWLGVITLERSYPLAFGPNISKTTTAILAALAVPVAHRHQACQ